MRLMRATASVGDAERGCWQGYRRGLAACAIYLYDSCPGLGQRRSLR